MLFPCSSCDRKVDTDEMDSYGRCLNCQEEYDEIEEETDDFTNEDWGNLQ